MNHPTLIFLLFHLFGPTDFFIFAPSVIRFILKQATKTVTVSISALYQKMCWMFLSQPPVICQRKCCFVTEVVPSTSKTFKTIEGTLRNSYSECSSKSHRNIEPLNTFSWFFFPLCKQFSLLEEVRLAWALLRGLEWHKEFSFLSKR